MSPQIINIIESIITLAIFYAFYKVFLRKETFFKLNRVYLLCSLIFAVTIPFFNITINLFPAISSNGEVINKLVGFKQGYNQLNAVIIYAYSGKLTWNIFIDYLYIIYLLGVFISSLFFTIGLIRIFLLILNSTPKKYGRYRIIESSKILIPFSLFRWIIINPEKHTSEDMEQIIAHEKMHAFQLHSIDLIIIEVLVILFWFNPFIYWYRKSIREVHEYLADQAVVENGYDRIDYQQLLFCQCTGSRYVGLTSRFSYSLSKNRLKMLTMMKSKSISKIKIALAIPIAIITVFLFANPIEIVKAQGKTNTETQLVTIQDTVKIEEFELGKTRFEEKNGELVYFNVEQMPKFQGKSADEFRLFIQKNLKYPEEAQKLGKEGRVFIAFTVGKNGDVKDVDVARGVHPSLDQEAIRVVNISPRWEPGLNEGKEVNVRYTFPIVFKLK